MSDQSTAAGRAKAFCERFGLQTPILLAPMAGLDSVSLAVAVANAGGMGAMGALLTAPEGIAEWTTAYRAQTGAPFQLNVWIPDPEPVRDATGRLAKQFKAVRR